MNRRHVLAAVALAVISLAGSAAHAGGILVNSDSGSIGGFKMTNMGISGGVATIEITGIPNTQEQLNTVNGVSVAPELVTFSGPITLDVKALPGNMYALSLVPSSYSKTIGDSTTGTATLDYNVSTGVTVPVLPDFFNASGHVTSLVSNGNSGYDFSQFANGLGTFNATFTATSFTGTSSFAGLFSTVGATATGNGSFSQIASVPEPASLALLGIGVTGFLAFRRILRKRTNAA
jgi:hypothetical protein